jgi:clan AA aspartic protease (TIGR02281 family)
LLAILFLGPEPRIALAARGDESGAISVLKKQGLERQDNSASRWILSREAEVLKRYRQAKELGELLAEAHAVYQQLVMGAQNPQGMIDYLQWQMSLRDARIAEIDQQVGAVAFAQSGIAASYHNFLVNEHNALVGEQRRLSDMINGMAGQRGAFRQQAVQFQDELAHQRELYLRGIEDLQDAVSEVKERYAELGKNREVAKAIADLSASSKGRQKVEPSEKFQKVVRWLERVRGKVQSETFTLRRGGGVDHLAVVLNGKGPVSMVFDTGAGPTSLPAKMAADLGLRFTGKTVPCRVADGSEIEAKVAIIRSVRVGQLEIKNVECAVMPPGQREAPPLLGQSFLRNFDYKYTQQTGRLVLTKVEPDEPVGGSGPRSRGGSNRRKGFNAPNPGGR